MPRDLKAHENQKRARARRTQALARIDLRHATTPRDAAAGPTSHAVKKIDTETRAAIDAFLIRKNGPTEAAR